MEHHFLFVLKNNINHLFDFNSVLSESKTTKNAAKFNHLFIQMSMRNNGNKFTENNVYGKVKKIKARSLLRFFTHTDNDHNS